MEANERIAVFAFVQDALERGEATGRGVDISEMVYRQMFNAIAQVLQDGQTPEQMSSLFQHVCEAYEYRDADELEGFAIGACWGALSSAEAIVQEERSVAAESNARKVATKYHKLLSAMLDNPGITHAELAEKIETSPSNLTQTISRLQKYGLFTSNKQGRTKRYSLSRRGKRIVSDHERRRQTNAALSKEYGAILYEQLTYNSVLLQNDQTTIVSLKGDSLKAVSRVENGLDSSVYATRLKKTLGRQQRSSLSTTLFSNAFSVNEESKLVKR